MNKSLLSILLCIGLAACSSIREQGSSSEQNGSMDNAQIENKSQPKTEIDPIVPEDKAPKIESKPLPLAVKTPEGKLILGKEEWVYVPGLKQSFKAKIDLDTKASSIYAVDIVPFEREGQDWVKFKLKYESVLSEEISLPVLRWARVKQINNTKAQKHPEVTAWIQVGSLKDKSVFILNDKDSSVYPIVLGQDFFRDVAIVDLNRKLIQPKKK